MAPRAAGIEVAEIDAVLHAKGNAREAARDLARDEGFAAHRRFVVEEDSAAGVHPVGLAVIHRDPVRVDLRYAVRRAWVERRGLCLRRLAHLAEHLGGRGLV